MAEAKKTGTENVSPETESLIRGSFTINSDIECDGELTIDGCTVNGSIKAGRLNFAGVVNGDLTADDEISLYRDAEIHGDLTAKKVSITGRVQIDGKIITG